VVGSSHVRAAGYELVETDEEVQEPLDEAGAEEVVAPWLEVGWVEDSEAEGEELLV